MAVNPAAEGPVPSGALKPYAVVAGDPPFPWEQRVGRDRVSSWTRPGWWSEKGECWRSFTRGFTSGEMSSRDVHPRHTTSPSGHESDGSKSFGYIQFRDPSGCRSGRSEALRGGCVLLACSPCWAWLGRQSFDRAGCTTGTRCARDLSQARLNSRRRRTYWLKTHIKTRPMCALLKYSPLCGACLTAAFLGGSHLGP